MRKEANVASPSNPHSLQWKMGTEFKEPKEETRRIGQKMGAAAEPLNTSPEVHKIVLVSRPHLSGPHVCGWLKEKA